jgi:hypothetical protein
VARPSVFSVEDKYRVALAVIGGELTMAEAARRGKASEQSFCSAHLGSHSDVCAIKKEAQAPDQRFGSCECRSGPTAHIWLDQALSDDLSKRRWW